MDPMCAVCDKGYGGGTRQPCRLCSEFKDNGELILEIIVLAFGGWAVCILWMAAEDVFDSKIALTAWHHVQPFLVDIKTFWGSMQIVHCLKAIFNFADTAFTRAFFNGVRYFALDIMMSANLSCRLDGFNYYGRFLLTMLLPFFFSTVIWVLYRVEVSRVVAILDDHLTYEEQENLEDSKFEVDGNSCGGWLYIDQTNKVQKKLGFGITFAPRYASIQGHTLHISSSKTDFRNTPVGTFTTEEPELPDKDQTASIDLRDATIGLPKSMRRGMPYCVRLDFKDPSTTSSARIIGFRDYSDMRQWIEYLQKVMDMDVDKMVMTCGGGWYFTRM